jgi:ATP-binding cassette subfamily B protein
MAAVRLLLLAARQKPGAFAVNLTLQIARTLLVIVPPLFIARIFEIYQIEGGVTQQAWLFILAVFVFGTMRIAVVLLATAWDGICRALVIENVTRSAVRSVLQLPGAAPLRRAMGDVVNRLSADSLALSDQAVLTLQMISNGIQVVVALAVMLSIDPVMTSSVVLPVLLATAAVLWARTRTAHLYLREREAAGQVSQLISDAIGGATPIELFGTRDRVVQRLRSACDRRAVVTVRSRVYAEVLMTASNGGIATMGVGLMLLIAVTRLDRGVTAGEIALFMSYLTTVVDYIGMLGSYAVYNRLAQVSVDRLEDAVPGTINDIADGDLPLAEAADVNSGFQSLTVEGLTYLHPGTQNGIRDVNFTIDRGELLIVVGHVGAGKTTLLRTLLGLLPADAGRVIVNGEIRDVLLPEFGYTPQRPQLVSGTVKENILVGVEDDDARVESALWRSVLDVDSEGWRAGTDTFVGSKGKQLSGGQVQRVAAARMSVREPEVYIVDDPSSALDSRTERELWRRMLYHNGATCIAVTHQSELVRRADRILVLDDGRVEALGSWSEVRRTSRVMNDLFPGEESGSPERVNEHCSPRPSESRG